MLLMMIIKLPGMDKMILQLLTDIGGKEKTL
jgi:hypothetical protein